MQTKWRDSEPVYFKLPEKYTDPVIVSQCFPDSSQKTIGHIFQNYNVEEGTVTYFSIGNEGEEIVPPTTEYTEAENGFEDYARQLSKKYLEKDIETDDFEEREIEISKIRLRNNLKYHQLAK